MKPLIVLLVAFLISLGVTTLLPQGVDVNLSGRIAMSVMLLFTAIAHFKFTEGMAMMLPAAVPAKKAIVYLTGIIEMAAAAGLLVTATVHVTGILLIIFFALLLPANIYAAMKKVDYEKATYEGKGTAYLWFRVPLQVFFIAWVWWFSVQK